MAGERKDLGLADALNVLASWEGDDVHVLFGAAADSSYPVAETLGSLGSVRVVDSYEGDDIEGIATYRVGTHSEFAILASAFQSATVQRFERPSDPPYEELQVVFDGWQLTVDHPPQDPDWLLDQEGGE